MRVFMMTGLASFLSLGCLVGCGGSSDAALGERRPAAAHGADVLLTEEPDGATGVIELLEHAEDNEQVVLLGRIGGAASPWIEGRAAFLVVDATVQLCDEGEGVCPCCQDKVDGATALVKLVDDRGRVYKQDARQLLNVQEDALVVVPGAVKRDDAGNLTVLASGVYVRR